MKKQSTVPYIFLSTVGFLAFAGAAYAYVRNNIPAVAIASIVGFILIVLSLYKINKIEKIRYSIAESDGDTPNVSLNDDLTNTLNPNEALESADQIVVDNTLELSKALLNNPDSSVEGNQQTQASNPTQTLKPQATEELDVLIDSMSAIDTTKKHADVEVTLDPKAPISFAFNVDTMYARNLDRIVTKLREMDLVHLNQVYDESLETLLNKSLINTPIWEYIFEPLPFVGLSRVLNDDGSIKLVRLNAGVTMDELETIAIIPAQYHEQIMTIYRQIYAIRVTISQGTYRIVDKSTQSFKTLHQDYRLDVTIFHKQ